MKKVKTMENGSIVTDTEAGNHYIDGSYRIWIDPDGGMRLKFDKDEIVYINKGTKAYNDLMNKKVNKTY